MRVIVVAVAAAIAIVQQNRAVRPSDPSFILVLIRARRPAPSSTVAPTRARRPTPTSTVAPIRTRHLTPNLARTRGRRPAPTSFTGTPTTGATRLNMAKHRTNPNMPFWKALKEGNDHFEVTHLEPKVDVCDRHYVFDAQPPANSTKGLAFSPTGHCPAYEVPEEIAGPALEKQRNDEYQIAQLTRLNAPVAPVTMGTDGGMNRVFVAKLEETTPVYDNDGHVHAPPIHPGMPRPMLSGPREDPQAGIKTASIQKPSLFGGLF